MNIKQILALKKIGHAILSSIHEAGENSPVPEGPMYAALMSHGISLSQFQQLLAGLQSTGLVIRESHTVSITEKGVAAISRFATEIDGIQKRLEQAANPALA